MPQKCIVMCDKKKRQHKDFAKKLSVLNYILGH